MTTAVQTLDQMQRAASETYRETVAAVADGDSVPSDLFEILMAAGKTPEQFKADVARAASRAQAKLDLAEAAKLDKQAEQLRANWGASHASTMKQESKDIAAHEARMRALWVPVNDLRDRADLTYRRAMKLREQALDTLRTTADPAAVAAVDARIDALQRRQEQLRDDIRMVSGRAPALPPQPSPRDRELHELRVAEHSAQLADKTQALSTVAEQIRELEAARFSD